MNTTLRAAAFFFCLGTVSISNAQTLGPGDISLRPGASAVLAGRWTTLTDASAAGGTAVWYPNAGAAKQVTALAQPSSYFELTFDAQGGVPYRLWLRLRAESNYWGNDSVFVQFSGAVDASLSPLYRIGTTSAAEVNLEDCKGCGISKWGWQDNGWGVGVLGPAIYFAKSGPQTLRVQSREDGAIVDQVLLSPSKYMSSAPGALKNDATILPATGDDAAPVSVVRGPYIQQAGSSAVTLVWATRESGTPTATVTSSSGSSTTVTGTSRRVSATTSGLGYDYYHHEIRVTGLQPSNVYAYDLFLSGADALQGTRSFRTAPARGVGTVRFVAFGDSGTGSTAQRQIAGLLGADNFDLALHTGDIAYGNTSGTGDASYTTYQDWFFSIYQGWLGTRALFTSEGNHDSRSTNNNGAAYLDLFTLPRNGASASYPDHAERYYSFDYGPVHFVALDTEFAFQDPARQAEQLSWLAADLGATAQPWKVAFFHRSPYSAGGEHGSDLEVRSAFGPIFEQFGVQLALSGHEHDYERTKPIQAGTQGSAVTYVVTGGGGGPLYAAATASWTAYSASRYHYVRAVADDCSIKLEAVGLDGSVFDSTSLSRCVTEPVGGDVILHAADAVRIAGAWRVESDTTAADGQRLRHPNAGAAKITTASTSPANYFEMTFEAQAGVPYHLWVRGKADANYWANDSVFVQFSGSVTATGASTARIGTTSAAEVNIEDCGGCGLSAWGWQDNGYASMGPAIYFASSGVQTLRVQTREDGLSVDQIVLSPSRFLSKSPGALKNDSTIIPK